MKTTRVLSLAFAVSFCALGPTAVSAADVDLRAAVVIVPKNSPPRQAQAVRMLVEEVEKRSQIRWTVSDRWPDSAAAVVVVGQTEFVDREGREHGAREAESPGFRGAEGYRIRAFEGKPAVVLVAGNDERGVLFGAGRLLREMRMSKGRIALAGSTNIATVPKYPLRGHQLGYRPKTNSYDAWSVPMWEQYIRDLAVFGTNAVELLPPRTDDDADSPHFPLPPMRMMVEMSRLLDQYGLDVWVWYPAMDRDYGDPATVERAIEEWAGVIRQLPRVDAIFVPGGDPGRTDPRILMPFLEKQTASLRRFHPKLQMWMSPQGFNQEWLDALVEILKKEPDWLTGIVYGPQVRVSLPELRKLVPAKYPIRRYPDITHCRQCQYPVQEWDVAYAVTEGREVINPRPRDEASIFRGIAKEAIGFLTYSEGCNDDVNKIVWSGLGWDPDRPVVEILRDYCRYFFGDAFSDDCAQGLLSLERNWRGPLLTNDAVDTTLQQYQALERAAPPSLTLNWRFQQQLYRAYYDAFLHRRLVYENGLEAQAQSRLASADHLGSLRALAEAEDLFDQGVTRPVALGLRSRVFELGDSLFQSIRMQLSVARHRAIESERGATLDSIDTPVTNRPWLKRRFDEIRKLTSERERLREIQALVHWADPGPGGFYDDLGNLSRQPHLVRGPGLEKDPGCFASPRCGFVIGTPYYAMFPISWWHNVEVIYDGALQMHYDDLDPHARYAVRISYVGDSPQTKIRLVADDRYEVHGEIAKPRPAATVEFPVPQEATRDGRLTLTWHRTQGLGGNGRGCAVAEIWLIKKSR